MNNIHIFRSNCIYSTYKLNETLLFRVPARMVVRRPAPINQLFNDESIAVQI